MAQSEPADSSAVRSVAGLLRAARVFGQAWAKRDVATLEHLLATEYVHTDIDGQFMRRAAWLDQAKGQTAALEISFGDLNATIYGDIGVVTGANELRGEAGRIGTIRFTQVWVWRGEKWQRIAFQATRVPS
jgi:hypothetical protein